MAAVIVTGLLTTQLAGCATLSEGECKTADWYQIGRQDGADGYTRARLYKHREACAEYGIRPDPNQYYAGRKVGLAHYCTPRNGFREGRAGDAYHDVCPAKTERAFLVEFRKGHAIHGAEQEVENLEREIDRKQARVDDDDTSQAERKDLRHDLRDLRQELRYRNHELIRLERDDER